MTQSVDVLVECVAVDCAGAHCRLIVVDGLCGIKEQRGYLLTVGHAKAH